MNYWNLEICFILRWKSVTQRHSNIRIYFVEVLQLSSSWSGLFATQTSQVGYLIHSCRRRDDFIFFPISLAWTWTQHCSQEFENDSKITTFDAGIRSILWTYYICKLMMQETFFFQCVLNTYLPRLMYLYLWERGWLAVFLQCVTIYRRFSYVYWKDQSSLAKLS